MPYIENAIERLDKKGVSFDNDGTETLVYSFKNRQGKDLADMIESTMLSGLRRDYVTKADERVPILGYIPLVGYLFRHEIDVKKSSEILILLTPCEVGKENAREHHLVDDIKNGEEDENAINKFVDRVILNKSL